MNRNILCFVLSIILLSGCAPLAGNSHSDPSPVSSPSIAGSVVAQSTYGKIIELGPGGAAIELNETPLPPERSAAERQKAIESIQAFWGSPNLSLDYQGLGRHTENSGMAVETYSSLAAQFMVDIRNDLVVYMQTNTGVGGIQTAYSGVGSPLPVVREFILARNPCFESREAQLVLEQGGKGSNQFFRWHSPLPNTDRPWNQPTFVQVGINEQGIVFGYVDSGICYLASQ